MSLFVCLLCVCNRGRPTFTELTVVGILSVVYSATRKLSFVLQAEAKHAYLDHKLKAIHQFGNGPDFDEAGARSQTEQQRAPLSLAMMAELVTTDYAVQDAQEDIEVCGPPSV